MCDMQRFLKDLRLAILNYRLDLCCFVFSVRVGILLCGCFNVISSMVCLIAVATEAVTPLLANAQQAYMDGEYVKSTCAFAYSSDLCLAVLLLCGLYRKDIVLLRYYTYCGLAMLASTVLVYSMVIGAITVLHTALMSISLSYQIYLIILVRSLMVEIRHEAKRLEQYPNYSIYWKLNDIEAADPGEAYEMRELVNKRTSIVKPEVETVKSVNEEVKVDPTISKPVKETTKFGTNVKEQVKDTVQPATVTVKDSVETKASDPDKDSVQPSTSIVKLKDTIELKTSEPVDAIRPTTTATNETEKTDKKPDNLEKPKALRYPYKFIAIKIPKEETIKEEKENEDREKEADTAPKEDMKEEKKEVAKETKKRKRSFFGRKIKPKPEDSKMKDVEKKD